MTLSSLWSVTLYGSTDQYNSMSHRPCKHTCFNYLYRHIVRCNKAIPTMLRRNMRRIRSLPRSSWTVDPGRKRRHLRIYAECMWDSLSRLSSCYCMRKARRNQGGYMKVAELNYECDPPLLRATSLPQEL